MAMRRHSQDDSGYIWYKDESTRDNHAVGFFLNLNFRSRDILVSLTFKNFVKKTVAFGKFRVRDREESWTW